MKNTTYDKIKLLHRLSELIWFIEKHALHDAENVGDTCCIELLKEVRTTLEDQLPRLQESLKCCEEFK